MNSKDLIKAGRLSEARKQLVQEVKSSPADLGRRTLLFQVLAFCGEWDKAERHLEAIATQDSSRETGVQVYKNLIHAERERMEVSKLNGRSSCLPEAPPYLEMYYAAWEKMAEKKIEAAQTLLDQIEAQRPMVSGTVNGKKFTGFKDTDSFLSLFLEAIVYERYVWIPFESIRELSITPPSTLFDLLWTMARVTTWEGLTTNCYLPVLYPESFLHEDERVKLGRITDWTSLGGPFSKGMGQHVFEVGEEEMAILDIREAAFDAPDTAEKDKEGEKND
jgi:type VI secretion system protein ImpE